MATTSKLGLPLLTERQVLKYLTINQAFDYLDNLLWITAINQTTNTPPGAPSENDTYIVGPSPTGDWAGKAEQITWWYNGSWRFVVPIAGMLAYDLAQTKTFRYEGSDWEHFTGLIRRSFGLPMTNFVNHSGASSLTASFTPFKSLAWEFTNGADESISGSFNFPKHLDYQNINCRLYWFTPSAATGSPRWNITIYNVEDGEAITSATSGAATLDDPQSGSSANYLQITTIGQFDAHADLGQNSLVGVKIEREGTHANDTFNQLIRLLNVAFEYAEKDEFDADWS
jgi:hypothetical protein